MSHPDPNDFANLSIADYRAGLAQQPHTLLDVRSPEEFRDGHLPGAQNVPLDDLKLRLGEVPQDVPVVVVCGHGIRSVYGAQMLRYSGHPQVFNLEGGTALWEALKLPLEMPE